LGDFLFPEQELDMVSSEPRPYDEFLLS